MSTLIEIGDEMRTLDSLIAELSADGGDITAAEETLDKWFAEIGQQRDQKIDNYCAFIRELELRAACRKEESERLSKRASTDRNTAEFLTAKLKSFFEEHRLPKIETERFRVAVVRNGGIAPLNITTAPVQVPVEYQTQEIGINKEKVRAALESGTQLPFASLGERGTRLSIR